MEFHSQQRGSPWGSRGFQRVPSETSTIERQPKVDRDFILSSLHGGTAPWADWVGSRSGGPPSFRVPVASCVGRAWLVAAQLGSPQPSVGALVASPQFTGKGFWSCPGGRTDAERCSPSRLRAAFSPGQAPPPSWGGFCPHWGVSALPRLGPGPSAPRPPSKCHARVLSATVGTK